MDIKQLMTFVTLADQKNFTKTAEELHYAQSNISNHIQKLEDEFQVKLFNRIGHTVSLTDKGHELLPYAKQILALHKEASTKLSACGTKKIVIGASESICSYILPAKIQQFRMLYPQIDIIISLIDQDDYLSLFEDGLIDLAFILDRKIENSSLKSLHTVEEPITLFSLPSHHLAGKAKVELSDLVNENLIVTAKSCCYRKALEADFTRCEQTFHPTLETSSIQIIKDFVMHDLGIGFLPLIAIQDEINKKQLVPLNYPIHPLIYSQLLIHKDKWISSELQAFIDLICTSRFHQK